MLTHMSLLNFKSWPQLELDLAPITILLGTNSSGKTSILQALLLLKQTAANFDRRQHINFGGGERDFVDFGSWRDLVFSHDEGRDVGLGLKWLAPWQPQAETGNRDLELFEYEVRWRYLDDHIVIEHLKYNAPVLSEDKVLIRVVRRENGRYRYEFPITLMIENTFEAPESCYAIPHLLETDANENQIRRPVSQLLKQINYNLLFENLMNQLHYLGPLRHYPQRHYMWTGAPPQSLGSRGENTVEMLVGSARDQSNGQNLYQQVATWLVKMGLVEAFQVEAVDHYKRLYEPRVSMQGVASALIDVGFGVSQVLPVITLLFAAPEGSIILLEQPELHLHPLAQAHLADLFLDVAERRHLQLIIESHSEHVLGRLQRRIGEAKTDFVTPDNIKLYFCQPGEAGSLVQPVEADRFGQIRNWPSNFFGDLAGDLDKMMDAGLERRRQELTAGG